MADLTAKQINFVSRTIDTVNKFMEAYEELVELRSEYDALDYGNTLLPAAFTGNNQHLEVADIVAVMTSQAAIEADMASGHRTNLLKARG